VKFTVIILAFILCGIKASSQDELVSGLFFSSHEVIQDKRTTLNVTPTKPFLFSKGFSLEFDAKFRRGDGYYGYIFRVIGDRKTNIDLIASQSTSPNFYLVFKDKVLFSFNWSDIPDGGFDRWTKIKININTNESKLSVSFNGNQHEVVVTDISTLRSFEVIFGACRNNSFVNTDVAPMSLKDIRIFDEKNKLINEWVLSKHGQSVVYDEIKHDKALVINPNWIIDSHVKWQRFKELKINSLLGITYDEENGRLLFVDNHAVYVMSTENSAIDTLAFAGGSPFSSMGNQILYNRITNEIWSYDFKGKDISKFSFATRKWSLDGTATDEPSFWHHNKFISPVDSSLTTILGYGFYTYKSIINHFNAKLKGWDKIDRSDQIQPRYLSAAGFLNNNEMLVFGGYGSKSGRQELSPEHYYDLYSFNLSDYSFKKLWTLETPSRQFVPCEDLITDQKSGIFYTLIYNNTNFATFLHLAKFEINKNAYQLFNDSIPYDFLDTKSWSTLFLDRKGQKLIAITSHESEVSLYSIAYPPLMQEEIYQKVQAKGKWHFWLVGILLAGILGGSILLIFRKKKRLVKTNEHMQKLDHPNIIQVMPFERKTFSSIFFIGGFQIYNSRGQNITAAFSPTLKQLFLYLFFNTIKNGKGISSVILDEVLWFDKSGESARNNRNVNISKLRTILEELEGVEVLNENSLWKINLGNAVYVDYLEIMGLLKKSKSTLLTEDEIHKLISLLSFGDFLPAVQTEWMDAFKSQFANEVIDGLSSLYNEDMVKSNFSLRYHLAECILVYDPLNDEAFSLKCSVLYQLGKKGMAKICYDEFCNNYKNALGIKYPVSFNDTIK
jgi:two-component SAPR family response regulator